MNRLLCTLFAPLLALAASQPSQSLYLKGEGDKGIILAHGKDKHPDFQVVRPLRTGLHEDLGYHTLSLQMPVGGKEYQAYEADQPKVDAMIDEAIAFLQERGVKRIYLMGHSLGAGMSSAYLVTHPKAPIVGYIAVGCRGDMGALISCSDNMAKLSLPVLDIWGRDDAQDNAFAQKRAPLVSEHYRQHGIEGANHLLEGSEDFFVEEVKGWLEE